MLGIWRCKEVWSGLRDMTKKELTKTELSDYQNDVWGQLGVAAESVKEWRTKNALTPRNLVIRLRRDLRQGLNSEPRLTDYWRLNIERTIDTELFMTDPLKATLLSLGLQMRQPYSEKTNNEVARYMAHKACAESGTGTIEQMLSLIKPFYDYWQTLSVGEKKTLYATSLLFKARVFKKQGEGENESWIINGKLDQAVEYIVNSNRGDDLFGWAMLLPRPLSRAIGLIATNSIGRKKLNELETSGNRLATPNLTYILEQRMAIISPQISVASVAAVLAGSNPVTAIF